MQADNSTVFVGHGCLQLLHTCRNPKLWFCAVFKRLRNLTQEPGEDEVDQLIINPAGQYWN